MITITAATGRYGRLVVEALLRRGVAANEIVAAVRFSATRGDWYAESEDLPRLLGRPSTPLVDVVATTLKRNGLLCSSKISSCGRRARARLPSR